ncbi:helix-turn-helix transcriptional regulator [Amycolatopsis minnesotensis]|uniref:Helix-turn-helix transcriptional regulator n=1 Tax=Amycolatopsis minnesotensis TaxID=337894 RepID=A0ABN2QYD8_9PSEU
MELDKPDALNVRQRRVARTLRAWLDRAEPKTSQVALAKDLGWSPAKLNKFLTARVPTPFAEIIAIATVLHVGDAERDRVASMARAGMERDAWWRSYSDALSGDFADFIQTEAEATSIWNVEMILVPGLVQTAAYSAALVRSWLPEPDEALIEERSRLRQQRQSRLTNRENPLKLHAVVHEAALEQEIGGPDTMRQQLDHLLTVAELPTVTLQLIPKATGAYPGFGISYVVINFDHAEAGAVYLESLNSGLYIEESAEVQAYTLNFERVLTHALPAKATVERIRRIRDGRT